MIKDIRILKESTCPSLSDKSTLTYHIGSLGSADIQFRIHSNSGNGFFSKEWVPLANLLELINETEKPFTWHVLHPLFRGKSVNTAGFLMAALMNEGLVRPLERRYESMAPDDFMAGINTLLAGKTPSLPPKKNRKKSSLLSPTKEP